MTEEIPMPFKFQRNRFRSRLWSMFGRICSNLLAKQNFPDDIEGIFIEINLRITKSLISGTYRPPSQTVEYFLSIYVLL